MATTTNDIDIIDTGLVDKSLCNIRGHIDSFTRSFNVGVEQGHFRPHKIEYLSLLIASLKQDLESLATELEPITKAESNKVNIERCGEFVKEAKIGNAQ